MITAAQAQAMGICVVWRSLGQLHAHEEPCRFCPTPTAELIFEIEKYRVAGKEETEDFMQLPREERQRKIKAAQAVPWFEQVTA